MYSDRDPQQGGDIAAIFPICGGHSYRKKTRAGRGGAVGEVLLESQWDWSPTREPPHTKLSNKLTKQIAK